jgi:filamentous hemagglutinin family protein
MQTKTFPRLFLRAFNRFHRHDGGNNLDLNSSHKRAIASVLGVSLLCFGALTSSLACAAPTANALPSNGQVVAGQAIISQSGNVMIIHQITQRAVILWDDFSVGKNATVKFIQPDNSSATLNKAKKSGHWEINGSVSVNGNGRLYFVNSDSNL